MKSSSLKYIVIFVLLIGLTGSIYSTAQISDVMGINNNSNSEMEIRNLIQEYFIAKNENWKGENKKDLSTFFGNLSRYSLEKCIYFDELRKLNNINVIWDKTNIDFISIKIDGNAADVNLYEEYKYQDDKVPYISSIGLQHEIQLYRKNSTWKIINIESQDEFDRLYSNKEFNLAEALKSINTIPKSNEDNKNIHKKEQDNLSYLKNLKEEINIKSTWIYTSYDRNEAVEYAEDHSDTTYDNTVSPSYNDLFVNHNPNDCQNFASQCLFAGFGGNYNSQTAIDDKLAPMIAQGDRRWWATSSSSSSNTNYGDSSNWWNWANCISFGLYFDDGGVNIEGPYGWIHEGTVIFAYPGDIIQIRSGTSGDDWYHAYVVTAVTGTQGGLTPADIYVCSHTANLNNVQLSLRCSNAKRLRVLRVAGHHYYQQ